MKKLFSLSLLAVIAATVFLAGCQATDETQQKEVEDQTAQQPVVVDRGEPFSNGPTTPPEMITGPSAPPTENPVVPAQAVTTNENIRITLPLKTE